MNKVEICNLALGNIRESSINSLTETSLAAQVCDQRFDHSVKVLLEAFPWRFARKTTALALLSATPNGWEYAYDLPSDCITPLHVVPENWPGGLGDRTIEYRFDDWTEDYRYPTPASWELVELDGDRAIVTQQAEAYLIYTAAQSDESRFNAHFVESLSWYLGAMIAIPLAGAEKGRDLRKDCLQIYDEVLKQAKAQDANQQVGVSVPPESPLISVRR